MTSQPTPKEFQSINEKFKEEYGFGLFMVSEPYLMKRKVVCNNWVGADSTDITLLKRNGKATTRYPKSHGKMLNGGHRPISLKTLVSNVKDGKPLFLNL